MATNNPSAPHNSLPPSTSSLALHPSAIASLLRTARNSASASVTNATVTPASTAQERSPDITIRVIVISSAKGDIPKGACSVAYLESQFLRRAAEVAADIKPVTGTGSHWSRNTAMKLRVTNATQLFMGGISPAGSYEPALTKNPQSRWAAVGCLTVSGPPALVQCLLSHEGHVSQFVELPRKSEARAPAPLHRQSAAARAPTPSGTAVPLHHAYFAAIQTSDDASCFSLSLSITDPALVMADQAAPTPVGAAVAAPTCPGAAAAAAPVPAADAAMAAPVPAAAAAAAAEAPTADAAAAATARGADSSAAAPAPATAPAVAAPAPAPAVTGPAPRLAGAVSGLAALTARLSLGPNAPLAKQVLRSDVVKAVARALAPPEPGSASWPRVSLGFPSNPSPPHPRPVSNDGAHDAMTLTVLAPLGDSWSIDSLNAKLSSVGLSVCTLASSIEAGRPIEALIPGGLASCIGALNSIQVRIAGAPQEAASSILAALQSSVADGLRAAKIRATAASDAPLTSFEQLWANLSTSTVVDDFASRSSPDGHVSLTFSRLTGTRGPGADSDWIATLSATDPILITACLAHGLGPLARNLDTVGDTCRVGLGDAYDVTLPHGLAVQVTLTPEDPQSKAGTQQRIQDVCHLCGFCASCTRRHHSLSLLRRCNSQSSKLPRFLEDPLQRCLSTTSRGQY